MNKWLEILNYDTRVIIYDRNVFIIQAIGVCVIKPFFFVTNGEAR